MARNSLLNNREIESRIDSAYHMAEVCGRYLSSVTVELKPIFEELNSRTPGGKRRYPAEVVGYARGYSMARWNDVFRNKVEFVYRHPVTLELYSTYKESIHKRTEEFYARNAGPELNAYERSHVWKGTDKPIAPWEVERDTTPQTSQGEPNNE